MEIFGENNLPNKNISIIQMKSILVMKVIKMLLEFKMNLK